MNKYSIAFNSTTGMIKFFGINVNRYQKGYYRREWELVKKKRYILWEDNCAGDIISFAFTLLDNSFDLLGITMVQEICMLFENNSDDGFVKLSLQEYKLLKLLKIEVDNLIKKGF